MFPLRIEELVIADGVKIYFNGGSVPLNVLYNTLSSTIVGS